MKSKISFILASSLSLFTNLVFANPIKVCDHNTRIEYKAEIKNKQLTMETTAGGNRSTFVYNVSGPTPALESDLNTAGLSILQPNGIHSSIRGPRKITSGSTYIADMNTNKIGGQVLRKIGVYTANDGASVILIWGTVLDSAHCLKP